MSCTHSKYETTRPPGIGQNVRYHLNAQLGKYGVGFRGQGAVGSLQDYLGPYLGRIGAGHLALHGRRHEDVYRQSEQFLVADVIAAGGLGASVPPC